ncbi:MAG: hypothetical protein Kow0069_16240 [Promethearchaeota archaeon]
MIDLVDDSVESFAASLRRKAVHFRKFVEAAREVVYCRRVPVEKYPVPEDLVVGSVDGSNNQRESVGVAVCVTRAVGVLMRGLSDRKPLLVRRGFPRELSVSELANLADESKILRDLHEAQVALELVEKMGDRPGVLMLDGPILPDDGVIAGIGRSVRGVELVNRYVAYFLKYVGRKGRPGLVSKLLRVTREKGVPVVGVVKRPRSLEYVGNLLGHDLCQKFGMHDALVLSPILEELQRDGNHYATEVLPTRPQRIHSYLDGVEHGDVLFSYLLPTRGAPPIRVEVPKWVDEEGRTEEVLSLVVRTAEPSHVGIPLPVMLAHVQCKLPEKLGEVLWRELEFRAAELGQLGLQMIKSYRGRSP